MATLSLTYYCGSTNFDEQSITKTKQFLAVANELFENEGFDLDAECFAVPPICFRPESMLNYAKDVALVTSETGFSESSLGPLGPWTPEKQSNWLRLIVETLEAHKNMSLSCVISNGTNIHYDWTTFASNAIIELSARFPRESLNFQFSALANVSPYTPGFAASYSALGQRDGFSLSLDYTSLANKTISQLVLVSPDDMMNKLKMSLEEYSQGIQTIAENISRRTGVSYVGMDTSLVPFPKDYGSVVAIIETLLYPNHFGAIGTLYATSTVASILNQINVKKCGLGGVVFSVLRDQLLANYNSLGRIKISDLLLYTTVGGIGLDLVPVSGYSTSTDIEKILLSIAAISSRTSKPLVARIIPIYGRLYPDYTEFDFVTVINSRILSAELP